MNDLTTNGPASQASAQEVHATFPSEATMQDAIEQLGLVGYDRTDLSLPKDRSGADGTPSRDDVDGQQLRERDHPIMRHDPLAPR